MKKYIRVLLAALCLATASAQDESCGSVRFEPAEAFGFKSTGDLINDLIIGLQANQKLYTAAKEKNNLLDQVNYAGQAAVMLDAIKQNLNQLNSAYTFSQEQMRQIQLAQAFVQERQNEYYHLYLGLSKLFDPNPIP